MPPIQVPRPQLHPHIFRSVLGRDYEPPPQKFDEVWPQLPPHDIQAHPAYPTDSQPMVALDPDMFNNLPPSVVQSQQSQASLGTDTSSHRDPIDKAHHHSKLLGTYKHWRPFDKRSQGQRQNLKLVGIDRGEHVRLPVSCDDTPSTSETTRKRKFIPWNIQSIVTEGREAMKKNLCNDSFLPTRDAIISLANSSWNTVAKTQTRGT
jgi:hypothetical protein